jgi:hypothetical protein
MTHAAGHKKTLMTTMAMRVLKNEFGKYYSLGSAAVVVALAATLVLFTSVAALALLDEQSFFSVDASAPILAAQQAFLPPLLQLFSVAGAASVVVVALCAIEMPRPITSMAADVMMNFFM